MSKRTRKPRVSKVKAKIKKIDTTIDFESWFWFATRDKKVNDWQRKEIRIFFEAKGLKDTEERSQYDETLKLY